VHAAALVGRLLRVRPQRSPVRRSAFRTRLARAPHPPAGVVGGQSIVGGALRLARNAGGDTARADGGPGV